VYPSQSPEKRRQNRRFKQMKKKEVQKLLGKRRDGSEMRGKVRKVACVKLKEVKEFGFLIAGGRGGLSTERRKDPPR